MARSIFLCRRIFARRPFLFVAFIACSASAAGAAIEGFGAGTSGGGGKPLYHVTSLADSGAGTLRDVVSRGNRFVVFDVAGTITLGSEIKVLGSYVTIDGFSAPAPGITIRGAGIRIDGTYSDVIIRGIRIRNPVLDGITIKNGASNVLVHNVSIDGCGDGNLDIGRGAHDITIAWSVLSGCAKNMLIGHESRRITLHHNAFVHSQWRNPWAKNTDDGLEATDTTIDMRNNLVWGWGNEGGGTGVTCGGKANVIANYYSSPDTDPARQKNALMVVPCAGGGVGGLAYAAGNVSADDLPFDVNSRGNQPRAFPAAFVDTHDACTAARDTLAAAGAEPLDSLDAGHLSVISLPCGAASSADAPPAPEPTPPPAEQLLELGVAGGENDSEELKDGRIKISTNCLQIGKTMSNVALRFSDVTIPRGAKIVSAKLRLFATANYASTIAVRYCGDRSGDSPPLGTRSRNLSSRTSTSACVYDRPATWRNGAYNDTPDLAAVVQEIVSLSGWNSGNDLTFLIKDHGSAAYRKISAYENSATKRAILEVRWVP